MPRLALSFASFPMQKLALSEQSPTTDGMAFRVASLKSRNTRSIMLGPFANCRSSALDLSHLQLLRGRTESLNSRVLIEVINLSDSRGVYRDQSLFQHYIVNNRSEEHTSELQSLR